MRIDLMLQEIKDFYIKTKLKKITRNPKTLPLAYTKVFHKSYPRFKVIHLPELLYNTELDMLLSERKSDRQFKNRPISLTDLAKILSSARITRTKGLFERRTYPSAGARFPIELYVFIFNGKKIKPGAYHYNVLTNSLEILAEGNFSRYRKQICSNYLITPAAALILTAVLPRTEVKYGIKAYPFSLIEAGHLCQNIQLKCAQIHLGSCPVAGFINDRLVEILDLNDEELPVYVVGLGHPSKHARFP